MITFLVYNTRIGVKHYGEKMMRNGDNIKPLNTPIRHLRTPPTQYIDKTDIKPEPLPKIKTHICTKCGDEYTLNPTTNTTHYCDRCHSSTHDSYEDIISAIEDQDLRDLKPYEHH